MKQTNLLNKLAWKLVLTTSLQRIAQASESIDYRLDNGGDATSLVDYLINDPAVMDKLQQHGCWCSKLHPSNGDLLGGLPQDELDELCRKWFVVRRCNQKLVGGTCLNAVAEGSTSYTVEHTSISPMVFACDNTGKTGCEADCCEIDLYWADQIRTKAIELNDAGAPGFGQLGTVVTCEIPSSGGASSDPGVTYEYTCSGTIPNLEIVKTEVQVNSPETPVDPGPGIYCPTTGNLNVYWDGTEFVDSPCANVNLWPRADGTCFDTTGLYNYIGNTHGVNGYKMIQGRFLYNTNGVVGLPCGFRFKDHEKTESHPDYTFHTIWLSFDDLDIKYLPPVFEGLEDLNTISIANLREMTHIAPNLFTSLGATQSLQTVSFQNNQVVTDDQLPDNWFGDNGFMGDVNLFMFRSNNAVTNIPGGWFTGFNTINRIEFVSNSGLTAMPIEFFNVPDHPTSPSTIRKISFNGDLSQLPEGANFDGLDAVVQLHGKWNSLPNSMFENMTGGAASLISFGGTCTAVGQPQASYCTNLSTCECV